VRIQNSTKPTIIYSHIHKVDWPVQKVLAFTTTRRLPQELHSVSIKPHFNSYDHFNLGEHVGDKPENVSKNRRLLLELLPSNSKIQWLDQVHGNKVVTVESHSTTPFVADAAITKQKNITLAIMTADCLPILLTATDGSEIAAIHCGWKPLAKDIIAKTVDKMQTSNENIVAWLGPCIGKLAFEVGEEVKIAFESQSEKFKSAFSVISPPSNVKTPEKVKYLADLAKIAKYQLKALGINNIHHLNHCTYSDEQQYYSYRRDHITGRMASFICRV